MSYIWVSGRKYVLKGIYRTWNEATNIGKKYKIQNHKRWFIKKGNIGYILYLQQ